MLVKVASSIRIQKRDKQPQLGVFNHRATLVGSAEGIQRSGMLDRRSRTFFKYIQSSQLS